LLNVLKQRRNYSSYLVIIIFFGFLVGTLRVVVKPELKMGDNVSLNATPTPLELGIVDCDCENLFLFDQTRKKLSVYNKQGVNLANYDFSFSGTVRIITIDETEQKLVVYYYRISKFYFIDFSGEVIDIIDDNVGYVNTHLEIEKQVGNYEVRNNIFWYSVQQDGVNMFNRVSGMPVVIAAAIVFFSGILFSLKRLRQN
jgi:hypothetical protein